MKEVKCKLCGGNHYRTFCFQSKKKPISTNASLKRASPIQNRKMSIVSSHTKEPRKYAKVASQSDSERKKLIRQADKVFSIYIRRRHAVNGRAMCVTCRYSDDWQVMQNGHYIARRVLALRWDETNCNVQCNHCNVELGGNIREYKKYLESMYGENITSELRSKAHIKGKPSNSDIQEVINIYSSKIAPL